jgi:hypothetical protein
MGKLHKLFIYVPEELWRSAKSKAALEGKTATLWVIEAIAEKLKGKEKNG